MAPVQCAPLLGLLALAQPAASSPQPPVAAATAISDPAAHARPLPPAAESSDLGAELPPPILPRWGVALAGLPADPVPEALANDTHFLASNEHQLFLWREAVAGRRGLYVGVGSDQNYVLAGWAKPDLMVLMDFDQLVVDLHQSYRAAFVAARDPAEFRSMWLPRNMKRMRALLEKQIPDKAERTRCVAAFYRGRPWVENRIDQLMREMGEAKVKTFLDDTEQYQWLAALYRANHVFAVRGDLTATGTMLAIGEAARAMKMPVRVLYLSNAERYFSYTPAYKHNILGLPFDERTRVLRTVGQGSHKEVDPFFYVVESGLNFHAWVREPKVWGVGMMFKHLKKEKKHLYTLEDLPDAAAGDGRAQASATGTGPP